MTTSKVCRIVSTIALIAALITIGYGIFTTLKFEVFNEIFKNQREMFSQNAGQSPKSPVGFMYKELEQIYTKKVSENMDSCLHITMNVFVIAGILIIVSLCLQLIAFIAHKKSCKTTSSLSSFRLNDSAANV